MPTSARPYWLPLYQMSETMTSQFVIAGLDTAGRVYPTCGTKQRETRASPSFGAIHPSAPKAFFRWMRGSSPRMTSWSFRDLVLCVALAGGRRRPRGRSDRGECRRRQHHQRCTDLHRRSQGLFPRGRPGRQSHRLPLRSRHGGAAWHRPARCRRRLGIGRALQCGCARHQDQDRRRQGVLGTGLRSHQDPGPQGSWSRAVATSRRGISRA